MHTQTRLARLLFLMAMLPSTALLAAPGAAPPSVATFMGNAQYDEAKVSPSGSQIAFTQRTADAELLTVLPLPGLDKAASSTFGKDIDVANFWWVNDRRLLLEPQRRFPGLTTYKTPTGEIFGLDANGKAFEILFGFQAGKLGAGKLGGREARREAAQIVDLPPDDPDHVIVQTLGYGVKGEFNEALRLDAESGRTDKLAGSPLHNGRFLTDNRHRVVLVHGVNDAGVYEVYFRAEPGQDWKLVASAERTAGAIVPFAHTSSDGEFFALDDRDAPTRGVVAWKPATGEQRLLFRNPDVDVVGALFDSARFPYAFIYVDHFPKYFYPDPEHPLAKLHVKLRSMFRDSEVEITSVTRDMRTAVALVKGPRNPGTYYVVDVNKQVPTHALATFPDLKREDLSDSEPIELTARDGLKIRGYLTQKNPDAKHAPLIVLVHGGPYGIADQWGFDPEAQLFASRGYAVLQVNFRGSGGRGLAFRTAGYGQWGRKMEDDVTDAVKWAIQDGVADAKRICIYGGSYGAYAALEGVVREPTLYRCAVGLAGVYDLPLMYQRGDIQTVERGENYLKDVLGTDTEELKRRSPVYNADQIHVPVLLIHGEQDERAPIEHAKRMRAALEKNGQKVEWMSEWGEAHGIFGPKERTQTYERILAFFDQNLAPNAAAQ
jgi:dipeptidyl aminopeptidase/acylaminoacyl peptidase